MARVVLADTETLGDLGRVVNAMTAVKELKEAGDHVRLIFDGAGTKWVRELSTGYCAGAFHVVDEVRSGGVTLLKEYEGHPSFRRLVADGDQIVTF